MASSALCVDCSSRNQGGRAAQTVSFFFVFSCFASLNEVARPSCCVPPTEPVTVFQALSFPLASISAFPWAKLSGLDKASVALSATRLGVDGVIDGLYTTTTASQSVEPLIGVATAWTLLLLAMTVHTTYSKLKSKTLLNAAVKVSARWLCAPQGVFVCGEGSLGCAPCQCANCRCYTAPVWPPYAVSRQPSARHLVCNPVVPLDRRFSVRTGRPHADNRVHHRRATARDVRPAARVFPSLRHLRRH
jgi:hypothetical protein